MSDLVARGKIEIIVSSPAPLTVSLIMDGIVEEIRRYAAEEEIEEENEIKEVGA